MEPEGSLPHSQGPTTRPYPVPDQSSTCPPSHVLMIHLNIILPSMPGSSKWFFSPPWKPCIHPSSIRAIPALPMSLFLITQIIFDEKYRSLSFSLCSFLHSPVTSFFLGPNILLSTLLSNTFVLHCSLSVSDQVSHPYKPTGKMMFLYILIFVFFSCKLEHKRCTEWQQAFPVFSLLLISSWMEVWFIGVVPKYLNYSSLSKHFSSVFILWFCHAFWSWDMTMYLVLSAFISRLEYITTKNIQSPSWHYNRVRLYLHPVYEYNGPCVFSEQLHQDVQVQCADVPATEPLRTVPAPCQLLLPVPVGAAGDTSHQLANPNHHCCASNWCAGTHCSKGCLWWLCEWQLTAYHQHVLKISRKMFFVAQLWLWFNSYLLNLLVTNFIFWYM